MGTRYRRILGIVAVSLVAARPAAACRCLPPPPPLAALAASTAVFSGTPWDFEVAPNGLDLLIRFDVVDCWKGAPGASVVVRTRRWDASCGYEFHPGRTYLVYATDSGGLVVSQCSRTRSLAGAREDLNALGRPQCATGVEGDTWGGVKRRYLLLR